MTRIIVSTSNSFWFDPWMSDIVKKNGIQLELIDPNKKYNSSDIINLSLRCKWNHLDEQYSDNKIIVEGQGESNSGNGGPSMIQIQTFYLYTVVVLIQMQITFSFTKTFFGINWL